MGKDRDGATQRHLENDGRWRWRATGLALALALALGLWAPASVLAATPHRAAKATEACRWTGRGANNRWSTVGNWTNCGGAGPRNGGAIEFPRDAARPASQNDIAGLSLAEIQISGTASGNIRYEIAGLPLSFTDTLRIIDGDDLFGAGPLVRAPIALTGRPVVHVVSNSLTLTGALSGDGALIKTGAGTLTVTGDGSYTGGTQVAGGRLIVNGHLNPKRPMIVDHGRLGGIGVVGRISCGTGVVGIGGSSTLSGSAVAGILHADGLVLAGTLLVGLHGPDPGTTYDQLDLTDDATLLIGASLDVTSGSFAPPKGTRFTILHVASGHTLTGTFENMPEGKSFRVGSRLFSITYHGGGGQDVVLTALD